MVHKIRRQHTDAFRAKVALEAVRGQRTIAELCRDYSVAPTQVSNWKKQLIDGAAGVFANPQHGVRTEDLIKDPLLREIGRLQVENAFLKKKCLI
jgi:putative transposase